MTPTNGKPKIVDADGHVLEPPGLWEEYLEIEYKDRAIRIAINEAGLEYIEIDGRPSEAGAVGTLGNVASAGKSMEWRLENSLKPGAFSYADGLKMAPGSCDSHERIKVAGRGWDRRCGAVPHDHRSDAVGVEGPGTVGGVCPGVQPMDHRFLRALSGQVDSDSSPFDARRRACSFRAPESGGTRGQGGKYWYGSPREVGHTGTLSTTRFGRRPRSRGLPVTIHPHDSVKAPGVIQGYYKITYSDTYWWHLTTAVLDMPLAVATLFQGGVFEGFPGLKIVILESGCGWLPWWLDRMDEKFEIAGFTTGCKRPPSEYFKEQCWISLDPDEHFAPAVISHVGADRFIWASDYPHADGVPDPVNELRKTLEALPEGDQRKVLGENAVGLYGL